MKMYPILKITLLLILLVRILGLEIVHLHHHPSIPGMACRGACCGREEISTLDTLVSLLSQHHALPTVPNAVS